MKPEAQRVAIAEACISAFICCRCGNRPETEDKKATIMRYGAPFCSEHCAEAAGDHALDYGQSMIPDYLTDLNAMHEAEKVLTGEQLRTYDKWLDTTWHSAVRKEPIDVPGLYSWHATAAQRCEAFLKTLNLWTP